MSQSVSTKVAVEFYYTSVDSKTYADNCCLLLGFTVMYTMPESARTLNSFKLVPGRSVLAVAMARNGVVFDRF